MQQLMRRLWKQKVSVLHVDSLPQDDISDLSLIGDTLSPISRPVISPIRRLFTGINKIIKTDMQVKDELNSCLITRSKGSVCRLNIKSILPSNYDQNAPVGIVNLLSPLHITILPNSKKHFIYNLASMDAKSGSLALLNSNLMEHAKLLVPAQRYYLDNEYLFLTLFKAKQGLESDTMPKKVVANILRNQLLEKARFESSQEADRNTKNVSLEIEGSSCHSRETIHDIINYNSENDIAPTNVKRQQQRFFESGSYKRIINSSLKKQIIRWLDLCGVSSSGNISLLRERLIGYIESENRAEVNATVLEDMINSLKSKDVQDGLSRLGIPTEGTLNVQKNALLKACSITPQDVRIVADDCNKATLEEGEKIRRFHCSKIVYLNCNRSLKLKKLLSIFCYLQVAHPLNLNRKLPHLVKKTRAAMTAATHF